MLALNTVRHVLPIWNKKFPYADGAVWKTVSGEHDPIKRLQFWDWWLTQAVPAAWYAVKDDSNVDLALGIPK